MATRFKTKKKQIQQHHEQNFASKSIQKCWMIKHAPRRRKQLYLRVLRLRIGMVVYCRNVRLACHIGSASTLADYLRSSNANWENPHVCIARFLAKVRLIQTKWRRIGMIKATRLEVYSHFFRRIEDEILNPKANPLDELDETQPEVQGHASKSESKPKGSKTSVEKKPGPGGCRKKLREPL